MKSIEIRLADDQHAALAAEAKAAGRSFFDHCRAKLMASSAQNSVSAGRERWPPTGDDALRTARRIGKSVEAPSEDGRIDRLEAMMLEMHRAIQGIANPVTVAEAQPRGVEAADVDAIVNGALGAAEQMVMQEQEAAPTPSGVRHVGTRPPMPFSVGAQPRHLR
jgi:hypothetical protein